MQGTGNSKRVSSNQKGPHQELEAIVRKHLQHSYRRPFAQHTLRAFEALKEGLGSEHPRQDIVLDSGCGVGLSTAQLALKHPGALVIGVDRSGQRLAGDPDAQLCRAYENYWLLRADLCDFWRLVQQNGWTISHHYLLYPNPYPKKAQIGQRWHGHPLFKTIVEMGGQLSLRTNWPIYAEEFSLALQMLGQQAQVEQKIVQEPFLTPFEEKYVRSGHEIFELSSELDPDSLASSLENC